MTPLFRPSTEAKLVVAITGPDNLVTTIERILSLLLKMLLSLILLFTAYHYFDLEYHRPERSPWIIGGTVALACIALVIAPYAGGIFADGVKGAANLFFPIYERYGRRASQGEIQAPPVVTEIELPPPKG